MFFPWLDFQCRVIFTCATCVRAIHEKALVSVKVEPRLTSRLSSALLSCLYFIYVVKIYVH